MDLRAVARRHWWTATVAVLAAVVLGLVVVMLAMIGNLSAQQARQAKAVTLLSSNLSSAQSQLREHGITPSQPPPAQIIAQAGPPGATGATGPQGPGPSDTQVEAAVAAYLAVHPIPAGPAGPAPSTEVVAAAVTAYLKANPAPAGPAGPTGAQGPGPSDQQIADAVATYLKTNPPPAGPQGPAGVQGSPGVQGPAGEPGAPGASGAQGAPGPAPAGWTFTMAGVTYECAPDSQQPAPHYTCTPQASPSPSPTSSSTAPAAKRHSSTGAVGSSSRFPRSWPVLLLSAVLVWPPEKRLTL